MNKLPFKEYHLLTFFDEYSNQNLPIDTAMSNYFRARKALGSKDKKFIAETAYSMMRWKGLIDHHLEGSISWRDRWNLIKKQPIEKLFMDSLPFTVKASAPEYLTKLVRKAFDDEKALEFFSISNTRAPLTIRANPALIERDALLERFQEDYKCHATSVSPYGITFDEHVQLFSMEEFRRGLFEVQDEGSQVVASLLQAKPGQHILDYCSGSGGKALAYAHQTKGQGQVYLYDIRAKALYEAKKRLKRAQIQNYQIATNDQVFSRKWKGKMDWIFVDAPCSGTGTLRRNPDLKWKIDENMLEELRGKQRSIFEQALSLLKPGGKIIYCTCSILPQENEDQVNFFTQHLPIEPVGEAFHSFPKPKGMDGFFAQVLKKH